MNANQASLLSSPFLPRGGESGHASSSSISPRNSPTPSHTPSLHSNGGGPSSRDRFAASLSNGWNTHPSQGLGLLHAQPRVLPRSFFGGSALDDSEASASGSGGEGGARGSASGASSGGTSSGGSGTGSGTPRSSGHHHSHHHHISSLHRDLERRRRFSQEEDDETPIENLPDLTTPIQEHELEVVPEGETVVGNSESGGLYPPPKVVRRTSCEYWKALGEKRGGSGS